MQYTEIIIFTTSIGTELVTDRLSELGFSGFSIEDGADIEVLLQEKSRYWWDYVDESVLAVRGQEPKVKLYIEADAEKEKKIQTVLTALAELREETQGLVDAGTLTAQMRTVSDEEWKDKWKEYFKPVHITERIVIKPTWEAYEAKPGELVIELDPGMAFGTGAHPTTAMCIRLLEVYLNQTASRTNRLEGQSIWAVLDVGCGSGILSLAAARLGAQQVMAVDIDPQAVEAAAFNASLNGMRDTIAIRQGDLTKGLGGKAQIIVANLMAELIVTLSGRVKEHLEKEGFLISSGILCEKRKMVEKALVSQGFKIAAVLEEEGWCAIAASLRKE